MAIRYQLLIPPNFKEQQSDIKPKTAFIARIKACHITEIRKGAVQSKIVLVNYSSGFWGAEDKEYFEI
jgi:hypothetical protein